MRSRITQSGINAEATKFISNSIRSSSQRTYSSAWNSWLTWCGSHGVDPLLFSEESLVDYLWFLFSEKHLSSASLGVHRAAICFFLDPLSTSAPSSKLLPRMMRSAFLSCPAAWATPLTTWNMAQVLNFLASWGLINELLSNHLSWCTFALLLLFSSQRIGDLVFWGIDPPFLALQEDTVTFQSGFSLKPSPSHRSPVIRLSLAPDESFCPVRHVRAYSEESTSLHLSRSFFITTTPPHEAAAHITLQQWFTRVLEGAGV